MNRYKAIAVVAAAMSMLAGSVYAQQTNAPPRPRDPAMNLPSDTGAQTTTPSGAVTGAGQPQGTGRQQDVGAPGGLEPRARRQAREEARGAGSATGATPGAGAGAADGARERGERRTRARREKG